MSVVASFSTELGVRFMSPLIVTVERTSRFDSVVPCVDGSGLAREIFTSQAWSVLTCVRPVCAVHMTTGHNALRGSGPGGRGRGDVQRPSRGRTRSRPLRACSRPASASTKPLRRLRRCLSGTASPSDSRLECFDQEGGDIRDRNSSLMRTLHLPEKVVRQALRLASLNPHITASTLGGTPPVVKKKLALNLISEKVDGQQSLDQCRRALGVVVT